MIVATVELCHPDGTVLGINRAVGFWGETPEVPPSPTVAGLVAGVTYTVVTRVEVHPDPPGWPSVLPKLVS